jgi:hypothetical protein
MSTATQRHEPPTEYRGFQTQPHFLQVGTRYPLSVHAQRLPPVSCNFRIGDTVKFTNEFGVSFPGLLVTGYADEVDNGRYIYLDTSSWWFPASPGSLTLEKPVESVEDLIAKPLTYGDSQALIVLAAHRLGLEPKHVEDAQCLLSGQNIDPMTGAAIFSEACAMNAKARAIPHWIELGGMHVQHLCVEYGFKAEMSTRAFQALKSELQKLRETEWIELGSMHVQHLCVEYGFKAEMSTRAFQALKSELQKLRETEYAGQDTPQSQSRLAVVKRIIASAWEPADSNVVYFRKEVEPASA